MRLSDILRRFIVKRSTLQHLQKCNEQLLQVIGKILEPHAAHHQDLWVLSETGKRKGFFIEFGGYDGVAASNTYVLEKSYGWNGIVVEPGKGFRENLISSRECSLDFRAIWDKTGERILFKEDVVEGYLSVASEDELITTNNHASEYLVETVSLIDLLNEHRAPKKIDYISVDIEGSEIRVLKSFFAENIAYEVAMWTVEHNFRNSKKELENLFNENGYRAVNKELSYRDYWFIKNV